MLDHGNSQLSAVGFFNPMIGGPCAAEAFGGGGFVDGVFGIDGDKVVNCHIIAGRSLVSCADTALSVLADNASEPQDGKAIYAKLSYASGSWSLSVHDDGELGGSGFNKENTLSDTYRLLYVYRNGAWVDCRWMPVVVAME